IRDRTVTGVQTCALPISTAAAIQAPNRPPRTKCFVLTSHLPRWTVRFPVGNAPLRVHLDHRYAVLVEDRRDLSASAVDYRIERGDRKSTRLNSCHRTISY